MLLVWFELLSPHRQQVPQHTRGGATLCPEAILILPHKETEMEVYHHPKEKKTLAAPFRG